MILQWGLHNQSIIVMRDGHLIHISLLLHHHSLLARGINGNNNNMLISTMTTMLMPYAIPPMWQLKEQMKTMGACLILALNIDMDLLDLKKTAPCA